MKTLTILATLALAAHAAAQGQPSNQAPGPQCSDVRNAGTLHLATGLWTAAPDPSALALLATPGVIYSNSCLPAPGQNITFAQALSTWQWIDDGRVPSTSSPAPAVGAFDRYRVTEFEFGYCTRELDPSLGGPGARVRLRLFEDYDECTGLPSGAPVADFTLINLPGSQTQGALSCVLMTIDLTGGFEFEMLADANGAYDGSATLDRFGVALEMPNQTGSALGQVGGFILAGQSPSSNTCGSGDECYYGNAAAAAGDGLDNGPGLFLDQSGATQCVQSLGGYPGVYLRLIADMDDCNLNAQPDVFDIASGTSQDVNGNDVPDECELVVVTPYCTPSSTTNGCHPTMSGSGTPSATQSSGFTIQVSNVEGAKLGLIFYGVNNAGFTPLSWASGSSSFLCVKLPTQRTPAQSSGGTVGQCNGALALDWNTFRAANPGALGAPFSIGQHIYAQGWHRDPPAPKTTNLSSALEFVLGP
ncbi:MAG: hypothetical protein IT454_01005 [Planctomycetes bacterium]|nr:hypothetical protein [Planctomycetota bacterium]